MRISTERKTSVEISILLLSVAAVPDVVAAVLPVLSDVRDALAAVLRNVGLAENVIQLDEGIVRYPRRIVGDLRIVTEIPQLPRSSRRW